jgi:hypothetical protein
MMSRVIARCIAALILLEPALDANSEAIKESTYSWKASGFISNRL